MALNDLQRKELLLSIEENKAIVDVYDSLGMKFVVEKCNNMIETYDSLDDVKDINDLNFKKGQLDILKFIVSYGETVRNVLEGQLTFVEKVTRD